MPSIDFECETPDCIHWNAEDGCTKQTSVTIQEQHCADYEERIKPKLIISISAGLVQGIYSTLSDEEISIHVVDFDALETDGTLEDQKQAEELVEQALKDMNTLY